MDPFGGCGTTLVEAKLNGRNSISLDVDGSAVLIAKAKKDAIKPTLLKKHNEALLNRINNNKDKKNYYKDANLRLKYWFKRNQFNKLYKIYNEIGKESDPKIRIFYRCCFSNILKNCSIWLSKSIKPQRDLNKAMADPFKAFIRHLNFMTGKNSEFYKLIEQSNANEVYSEVKKADARKTGLRAESIDFVVTSPPYATSYEYADIHQLSLLWFGMVNILSEAKKSYIGSTSKNSNLDKNFYSSITAKEIIKNLERHNARLAGRMCAYFLDLEKSLKEIHRVLKRSKCACIIIGDTEYRGVKIKNTEISIELLKTIGFKIERVIKRKISSKTFTPYRDITGRFSEDKVHGRRDIYPYEYIIVAKKVI